MEQKTLHNTITVFTDGGARGNPGPAAYGVVIKRGNSNVHTIGKTIGSTTNNIAEYCGVVAALSWLLEHRKLFGEVSGIHVFADSKLIVSQLTGVYRIKNANLKGLHQQIKNFEQELGVPVFYTHIPRERNKEADRLVNQSLDKKE